MKTQNALSEVLQWACSPRGGNNLYGRILNGCSRKPTPGLGTAAVALTPQGKYLFLYDLEWFTAQPRAFQVLVVVHEAAHLVLEHIPRVFRYMVHFDDHKQYKRYEPIFNIAMDMAVNDVALRPFVEQNRDYFGDVAKPLVWPEQRDYPKNKTFEEYTALLIEDLQEHGFDVDAYRIGEFKGAQSSPDAGGSGDSGDSEEEKESKGSGGSDEEKEEKEEKAPQNVSEQMMQDESVPSWFRDLLRQQAPGHISHLDIVEGMTESEIERAIEQAKREGKRIVNSAVEQTHKGRGVIPGHLQHLIDALLEEPTIPWEVVLRGMLKSSVSAKLRESTIMPNAGLAHLEADLIEPYPFYQRDMTFHIDLCVDTSGSVSDTEYIQFMGEIAGILRAEEGVSARFIAFDHAIQQEELLSSDSSAFTDSPEGMRRYGYGGTQFNSVLRRVLGTDTEDDWLEDADRITERVPTADLVIIFTDGYAPISSDEGGPIPELSPPAPLIWAITPSGKTHPDMVRTLQIGG